MKIIINNTKFDFNIGCRILKMKYAECPANMEETLGDMWNDIQPLTFQEIATEIKNLEQRRIAISCLGIDNVIKQVEPILVDKQTLSKTTTWVNADGKMETISFNDTYELYEVSANKLFDGATSNNWWNKDGKFHFVKCKCTSTDRDYHIWVDEDSVVRTNRIGWEYRKPMNAIQAIAWTIQTNIPKGNIEKIVRQGDCILIKPNAELGMLINTTRHLTEEEYRTLLVAES
jgi:hypothetical protein